MPQDRQMNRQRDRQTDKPDSESRPQSHLKRSSANGRCWHLQTEVPLVVRVNTLGVPVSLATALAPPPLLSGTALTCRGSQAGLMDSEQPLLQRSRGEAF